MDIFMRKTFKEQRQSRKKKTGRRKKRAQNSENKHKINVKTIGCETTSEMSDIMDPR